MKSYIKRYFFLKRGSYIYMEAVIIKQLFSIFQNVDNHYPIKKQAIKNTTIDETRDM